MFPSLPSSNNPYAAQAGQFASAASAAHHASLTAALEAERQKQQLAHQQAQDIAAAQQRSFQNRLELERLHAVPSQVETSTGITAGGKSLKQRSDNPAIQEFGGQGTYVNEPGSEGFYIPSTAELAKRKRHDEGGFVAKGPLGEALAGAGWPADREITQAESAALMRAINDAMPKEGPIHIDTSGHFLGPDGNPVPVAIHEKTGQVRMLDLSNALAARDQANQAASVPPTGPVDFGGFISGMPGGSPGGPFANPEQPPAPGAPAAPAAPAQRGLTFSPTKTGQKETADDWVRIITDPKSSPAEQKRAKAALDLWRAPGTESDKDRDLTRAALEAERKQRQGERAEDRDERQKRVFRDIEKGKNKQNADAVNTYRKTIAAGPTAADTTSGDPQANVKKRALAQLRSDLGDNQREYEGNISGETGQPVTPNTYFLNYDPEAPGTDPAGIRTPGRGGAPQDPAGIRPKAKR